MSDACDSSRELLASLSVGDAGGSAAANGRRKFVWVAVQHSFKIMSSSSSRLSKSKTPGSARLFPGTGASAGSGLAAHSMGCCWCNDEAMFCARSTASLSTSADASSSRTVFSQRAVGLSVLDVGVEPKSCLMSLVSRDERLS